MTDKVQKILSEIATRKLCTMDEHMAFYNDKAKEDYWLLSEIEEFIKASQEEPVSEELGDYINELSKQFPEVSFAKLSRIAVRVSKWKEEQFEKNRIEHCEGITEEQYNLETKFLDLYIKRFNRLPTILDAIEYGKTLGEMLMIGEAIETTFNVSLPCGVYDKLKAKGCEEGDKLLIIKKEE